MQLKKSILRLADLVFSLFCLLLLFPLLFIIALLVKASSPGPVFYKQIRVSANGRKFTTVKFRTMYVRAEPKAREEATKVFYLTDDPQVTAIGSFLRRTNLDELPRFYNVLSGETSLFSGNNASIGDWRISSPKMAMPPLYTLLTRSLISQRILLVAGFLGINVTYHLSCSVVDSFLNYIVGLFCLGLLFDITLIKWRYKDRIYGTSAQELFELKNLLEANFRRRDFQGWDGKGPLYPQVKDEVESESSAADGATVRA